MATCNYCGEQMTNNPYQKHSTYVCYVNNLSKNLDPESHFDNMHESRRNWIKQAHQRIILKRGIIRYWPMKLVKDSQQSEVFQCVQ